MIVDFHTHVDSMPALGWEMPPEAILRGMANAGVDVSVVTSIMDAPVLSGEGLDRMHRMVEAAGGKLLAMARLHPWSPKAPELLTYAVESLGFVGLKLHPVSTIASPSGEPTLTLIREAERLGVPTLFHCADDNLTTPFEVEVAAQAIPGAAIVLGHSGGYAHGADAIEVARRNSNVWLETACIPYPGLLKAAVNAIGADRLIFGSDAPGADVEIELNKIRLLGLTDGELAQVCGANALRLIGIAS